MKRCLIEREEDEMKQAMVLIPVNLMRVTIVRKISYSRNDEVDSIKLAM